MIVRDNNGNIIGELSTSFTSDGRVITTNTQYSNGRPAVQTISIRDSQGHVETQTVRGDKILP